MKVAMTADRNRPEVELADSELTFYGTCPACAS
jgi:Fe2+ or Zn2+ uptake regulation protein